MTYTVTTTSGTTQAVIDDGTIDTLSTSLSLIGKNYAGYGNFLNENFVRLLENFTNVTPPSAALVGQLWYDNSNLILNVYDGDQWKPISSSASSATAPTGPVVGDLWWDTSNAQLKVWSGTGWVTVGPTYTSSGGTSGAVVETILDSNSSPQVVVKFYISNSVIAIVSSLGFVPLTSIAGFTTIAAGLTLSSTPGILLTGAASTALLLNGYDENDFLQKNVNIDIGNYSFKANVVLVKTDLSLSSDTGTGAAKISSLTNAAPLEMWITKSSVLTKALSISGTTGNVTLTNPLDISSGGTGATTASDARAALGITGLVVADGNYTGVTVSATGTIWTVAAATTVISGAARYATNSEVQTGTINNATITPQALQTKVASSTAIGLSRFSTSAEVTAGSLSNVALSPQTFLGRFTGTSQSLGTNGYQKFPGGLIIQWGQASGVGNGSTAVVSLPTSFSSAIYSVTASPDGSGSDGTVAVTAMSTSSISLVNDTGNTRTLYWMAFGT